MLTLLLVRHFGITTGGQHTRPVRRVRARGGLTSLGGRSPRSAGRRVPGAAREKFLLDLSRVGTEHPEGDTIPRDSL
jgi:hypothetical protein